MQIYSRIKEQNYLTVFENYDSELTIEEISCQYGFYYVLAKCTKMCYTYDSRNRVTSRTVKNMCNEVLCCESFTYDAAGNISTHRILIIKEPNT